MSGIYILGAVLALLLLRVPRRGVVQARDLRLKGLTTMTANGWIQLAFYLAALIGLSVPLGPTWHGSTKAVPSGLDRVLGPLERLAVPRLPACAPTKR